MSVLLVGVMSVPDLAFRAWQHIDVTTWLIMNVQLWDASLGRPDRASLRNGAAPARHAAHDRHGAGRDEPAQRAMAVIASPDELTKIHDRRGWFDLAEQELARAGETAKPSSSTSTAEQVDDVLGHKQGDRAIASAAAVARTGRRRPACAIRVSSPRDRAAPIRDLVSPLATVALKAASGTPDVAVRRRAGRLAVPGTDAGLSHHSQREGRDL